jgi:hypothetical protein
MGRCRFVQPETVRLSLSDGEFVDIKKELNAGEQRRVFAGLVKHMGAGETIELAPEQVGLTKLLAYLIGWSLVDANEKPVPVNEGAINALDSETYAELVAAIDAHEEAVEKARAMRKNAQNGESRSNPT